MSDSDRGALLHPEALASAPAPTPDGRLVAGCHAELRPSKSTTWWIRCDLHGFNEHATRLLDLREGKVMNGEGKAINDSLAMRAQCNRSSKRSWSA